MEQKQQSEMELHSEGVAPSKCASILRFVGSCMLLAGAIAYMLDGWYAVNHIARYLKFLGVTGLLSAAGVATGLYLKENRGARTFMALAVAAIPVNFCQLGALLYSVTPGNETPADLTQYLLWKAPSLTVALGTAGGALLVLAAVTWVSLSVLGRQGRTILFPAIMAANTLLLLPFRGVTIVCLLALVGVAVALLASYKLRDVAAIEYTFEGIVCRMLLWVPSSILLLRTAMLYEFSTALTGIICLYLGAVLLAAVRVTDAEDGINSFIEFVGGSLVISGIVVELHAILTGFGLDNSNEMIALISVGTLIAGDVVSRYLPRSGSSLAGITLTIACAMAGLYGITETSVYAGSLAVMVGSLGRVFSYERRSEYGVFLSSIALLTGVVQLAMQALPILMDSWLAISLSGVGVVFLASMVEKGKFSLRAIGEKHRARLS